VIAGLPQGWTFEQTVHFLQTGIKPGGGLAGPPMPEFRFNRYDAFAVATYLHQRGRKKNAERPRTFR
jgi:hypothetical protein